MAGKAAKIIVVAVNSTSRPVSDARRVAPGWPPPPPSPHCPAPGPAGPLISACEIDRAMTYLLVTLFSRTVR